MARPSPVKISQIKIAAEGGRIDFMFLGPPTRPLDLLLMYALGNLPISTVNSQPYEMQILFSM